MNSKISISIGIVLLALILVLSGCSRIGRFNAPEGTSWGQGVFTSNGERIYFTSTSDHGTKITYKSGPSSMGWMMMNGQLASASYHGPGIQALFPSLFYINCNTCLKPMVCKSTLIHSRINALEAGLVSNSLVRITTNSRNMITNPMIVTDWILQERYGGSCSSRKAGAHSAIACHLGFFLSI